MYKLKIEWDIRAKRYEERIKTGGADTIVKEC